MAVIGRYFARLWRDVRMRRAPDRYLADGERVVELEGGQPAILHRHPAVLLRSAVPAAVVLLIAFVGGLLAGPGTFSAFLWWLTVPFVLWLAWKVFEWRFDRIVLTNRRIIVVDGLLVRKAGMMPFVKVTDLGYTRSLLGRLLGYGSVRLETAGQVQDLEHIHYIPDPDTFYRRLSSLVLGPAPVSESEHIDVLRAIRDEIRDALRSPR